MDHNSSSKLLLILLISVVSLSSLTINAVPVPVPPSSDLSSLKPPSDGKPVTVQQACATTRDPSFCESTLAIRPESKGLGMKGMGFLVLMVAREKGTNISDFISATLGDENKIPDGLDQALSDCSESYQDALAQIENAMNAFVADAPSDVEIWMNTAIGDAKTCGESIKDSELDNVMGDRDDVFSKLCGIAADISKKALGVGSGGGGGQL